jgi:glutamate carboxypeptidase
MGVSILIAMPDQNALRRIVDARLPRFLAELESLVNIDCGSYTPEGVNRVADVVTDALAEIGASVERLAHQPAEGRPQLGDLVIGRLDGDGPRLLLIGHMDTVFDPGTAAARPYRASGDRATGPGVTDMKAGLLAGLHAIAALHEAGERPAITFVANPDEEIGSPFSTPTIRSLAPQHDVVLVLECAERELPTITSTWSGGRRTRVSSPRRAARPFSRLRTWCWPSTRSTAAGRR